MHTIEKLRELGSISTTAVRAMEARIERLNSVIERLEGDGSRSREFIVESVKAERQKVLPALASELETIRDANKEAAPQKRFWESRALLLSVLPADPDPAKDAAIKGFWLATFKVMPMPLLQLAYENARFDGNLPLIWAIFSVGQARGADATPAAALDMSLDGLDIPDQAEALAHISTCWSNVEHGEMLAAVAAGLRIDPVRKMHVARQQQVSNRLAQPFA